MGTPITDPHVLAAMDFVDAHYAKLGGRAPVAGSREEQHAISVLAAYIRDHDPQKWINIAAGMGNHEARELATEGFETA